MARNIHQALYYERRGVLEAQHQLHALNEIVWEIQKALGKEFIEDKVWTWGLGIQFRDTTKAEFNELKKVLPDMGTLEKRSTPYGLQLEGTFSTGKVQIKSRHDNYEQNMYTEVRFKWGIPDTCTIKEVETVEQVNAEDFFTEDGGIYRRTITKEVECTQPLLESVFADESHERAN